MDNDKYLSERLDTQIQWYDNKSVKSQKKYKLMRAMEIVFAACIPLLSSLPNSFDVTTKIVIAVLGTTIVILAGINTLNKYQELWISYRTTAETLKHHKFLFITGTFPYNRDDNFSQLVENVEAIISKENSNWTIMIQKNKDIKEGNETMLET